MLIIDNNIWLTKLEYVTDSIINEENYFKQLQRDIITAQGRGDDTLISFDSLPPAYKKLVHLKYGSNLHRYISAQPIKALVKDDTQAREYYAAFRLADGRPLPVAKQAKYIRQAEWLRAIDIVMSDKHESKELTRLSVTEIWDLIIQLIKADNQKSGLPTSSRRLRERLKAFRESGYFALIETARFGNDNSRIVTGTIENLIMALYIQPGKMRLVDVQRQYIDFMAGKRSIVDEETGEIFDPKDFYVKGKPYALALATIKYYINKPANRARVDKVRMSGLQYATKHLPYAQMLAPVYSMSKITMDDTSSPFKMLNGQRPATYKAFDVASGAMLACVMHRDTRPDVGLIREMLRVMLGGIAMRGWVMPYEVEVENALTSTMTGTEGMDGTAQGDVLTAGVVFPFVRFCAPRNPQEKVAERFIRGLKYGYQRWREGFQFRPFGRSENFRKNDDSKWDKRRYTFEEIYAMELEDMWNWNNALHPNQEEYPGMTRWQVLEQCQNPNLAKPNMQQIMPYIGNLTATSLRRGYVQVQGRSYRLENAYDAERLDGKKLQAYWIKDENNDIPTVYLYQGARFVSTGLEVEKFQSARIEQTEEDLKKMGKQRAYIADYRNMVDGVTDNLPRVATTTRQLATAPVYAPWQREDHEMWAEDAARDGVLPGQNTSSKDGENAPENPAKMQKNTPKEGGYVQNNEAFDPSVFSQIIDKQSIINRL